MYTEEPKRNINWGNLLKKGLIILAIAGIIFLIIWLITKNNANSVDVNYDGNTNINETINTNSYSEEFINNYRYFHDTAKEYFLISELPKNGETLKFTLQELINKGLILPFSYNGETCDTEASYVTVTNNDGEYTMTTTLVCGKEVAKTTMELGCNQLCETGDCKKEEIEYQFKQAYKDKETTYSCPAGYSKSGSKCIKSDKDTINAIKNVTYSCPAGYTKNGTKCTITNKNTIDATKNVTYSCPAGYSRSGSKCYKTSKDSVDAIANTTYSCPAGYTRNGDVCTKSSTSTINATASTTYSCPAGYSRSGSTCTKTTTDTKQATSNIKYSCPSGYTKNGSTCIKYLYTDISYGTSYQGCPGGQRVLAPCSSGNCTTYRYVYKCSKGVSSATTYSCPAGYTRNNTTCTKTTTDTRQATTSTTYSCPAGYSKSGSTCTKTTTDTVKATTNTTYKCNDGYALDGKKCYKTTNEEINATKKTSYSCPDKYSKDGTKCVITDTKTKDANKNTTYTCKDGYTKVGIGSSSVCTKGSTTTINATKSTKEVTKYRYKWSSETSLEGWERTGQTRTSSK